MTSARRSLLRRNADVPGCRWHCPSDSGLASVGDCLLLRLHICDVRQPGDGFDLTHPHADANVPVGGARVEHVGAQRAHLVHQPVADIRPDIEQDAALVHIRKIDA
jgi:hypothetical protein